jgi:hypothetical protein
MFLFERKKNKFVCIFQLMTCIELEAIQLSTHRQGPCILAGRLYGNASGADYRSKEAGENRKKNGAHKDVG